MKRIQNGTTLSAVAVAIASTLMLVTDAFATIVAPMPISTLADHSAQVVEARVTAMRSYWANNPRRLETQITFTPVQFLKGKPAVIPETLRLIVPGGTFGNIQMRIAGAPVFRHNDQWLLFLLPTYKTYPIVGISRGAFQVRKDATGVARILDASGHAVTGFDSRGFAQTAGSYKHATKEGQNGATPRVEQAVTRDDFIARIRPVLDASRKHDVTQPAGRPTIVQYTPVSLPDRGKAVAARQPVRGRPPMIPAPPRNRPHDIIKNRTDGDPR